MDDKRKLRLIGQGKTEYINDIARTYYDDIYRFCCFQTGDREWAYDLTQETFLRFIRYVDSMKGGNLKGYLLTIAMNVCRDGWKEKNRRGGQCSWEACAVESSAAQESAAREEEASQERTALWEGLLKLPDFQREAIVLHYYSGLKYREIAKMTGTGVSTVKSRIRQGCMKLKELLEE